jgi:pyridoxamine 5'-phosphate oxidase
MSETKSVADLRRDYRLQSLDEGQAPNDPLALFAQWFVQAQNSGILEPNAMTLATVKSDGTPSARIVLLKGHDASGFSFFTNYQSAKGQELATTARAALVFFWDALERQVRVEGTVERLSPEESDAYFHSRPLGSRLGAWASPQSQSVSGRAELERRLEQASDQWGDHPPRPEHWGGYRVLPHMIEFWQGRSSRLHDRLRYTAHQGSWQRQRLAP